MGIFVVALLAGMACCTRPVAENTSSDSTKSSTYAFKLPAHLAEFVPEMPERNPITQEGVALGEALFFDQKLSRDGSKSCATCHMPRAAFASNEAVDEGVFSPKKTGTRNTPSIMYSAWGKKFFWDGGAANLESQALAPLTDSTELGASLPQMLRYLNGSPGYKAKFKSAFGIDSASTPYVLKAMAQFERSLFHFSSKWDSVQMGKAQFSEQELKGEAVFAAQCADCHTPPLFTDNSFHNKGLQASYDSISNHGKAAGRYRITHRPAELGAFKTPSLRNVALTKPYGHDGSVRSLPAMLDRMDGHLHKTPWLDKAFVRADGKAGLKLSNGEKNSLVAFLNCLSD
jgi:cytochrome c peroxidase